MNNKNVSELYSPSKAKTAGAHAGNREVYFDDGENTSINSSFTPYYVQEISLTMSSLLDTMGIAWRASLSMQLWCQGLRSYQVAWRF